MQTGAPQSGAGSFESEGDSFSETSDPFDTDKDDAQDDEDMAGTGSHKNRIANEDKFNKWTLTFKNRFLEEEFFRKWDNQNLWPATFALSVYCGFYVLALLLFNVLQPEDGEDGETLRIAAYCANFTYGRGPLQIHNTIVTIIGFLTAGGLLFILRRRWCSCETGMIASAVLASARVYLHGAGVMNEVFQIQGDYTMAYLLTEANRITVLFLLNNVVQSMRVRSSRSWILPVAQCVMLLAAHIALTPRTWRSILWYFLLFAVASYFPLVGRRREELRARQDYLEKRELRAKMSQERTANKIQAQRMQDIEDRMSALDVLSSQASRKSRVVTNDGEPKQVVVGQLTSLMKEADFTVPPPPQCGNPAFGCSVPASGLGPEPTAPNKLLRQHMSGRSADAVRIRKMASQITSSDYNIQDFFEDAVAAFPELELFFAMPDSASEQEGSTPNASALGRSRQQAIGQLEYQRTIGALFSVYWLLRLDGDGKQGFCFGTADDWRVQAAGGSLSSAVRRRIPELAKREAFLRSADWPKMQEMVKSSVGGGSGGSCTGGGASLDVGRVEAMLCLTAFHDVLKLQWLCPQVTAAHAPYKGYEAGVVIQDHDIALAYVMEHYPELIPSYSVLPPQMKELLLFTQSKMQFNHGWLVQAEAPPGIMLRSLKGCLAAAKPGDLPFYFFHWLTDVSGADGTPKGGAEKFVLKFPEPVLAAFLRSIPYLEPLAEQTETHVTEEYLVARWQDACPNVSLPTDESCIALLRLTVMAQGEAGVVVEAFNSLPLEAQEVLSQEMALTGCQGQSFERCPCYGGPAFLIYYGPALLQRCRGVEEVSMGLQILAAVFAAGRALWPRSLEEQGSTVVINVGQLRAHDIQAIVEGAASTQRSLWVMTPNNSQEASLELLLASDVNNMNRRKARYWVLDFRSFKDCDLYSI